MTGFAVRVLGVTIVGFLISALVSFWLLSLMLDRYIMNRLDDSLKTQALDVVALLSPLDKDLNAEQVSLELARLGASRGVNTWFFRIFTEDGETLAESDLRSWPELNEQPVSLKILADQVNTKLLCFNTRLAERRPAGSRALALSAAPGLVLEVGIDLTATRELVNKGKWIYGVAMLMVVSLGSLLGALATRKPLGGIAAVGLAATRVTQNTDFSARVSPPTGSVETDHLAQAFNAMVDKIQALLQGQREMTDSIAHDMRSPVTRMRAAAEAALHAGKDVELCGQVIEDCDCILNLVNGLLEISAAEAGAVDWLSGRVNLSALVEDAGELFEPLLEYKQQQLQLALTPNLEVRGKADVLQRIVANLLDNAIKYTGTGGSISLSLELDQEQVCLCVKDTGRGLDEAALARIFERFYRVDASRGEPGNGLGLSFCKAAVEALGGKILVSSRPQQGTEFRVLLPEAPAP